MPFSFGPVVFAVSASAIVAGGYIADALTTIDDKTKIPLFIVCGFGVAVWRAGVWLTKKFDRIEYHLDAQDKQISGLDEKFQGLACQRQECPKHDSKHK